jgi:hypothetical protein
MSQNTPCRLLFPYRYRHLPSAVRLRFQTGVRRHRSKPCAAVCDVVMSSHLHDGARETAATAVIRADTAALAALRLHDGASSRGNGGVRSRHFGVWICVNRVGFSSLVNRSRVVALERHKQVPPDTGSDLNLQYARWRQAKGEVCCEELKVYRRRQRGD